MHDHLVIFESYIDALKRGLIDTSAYWLQASSFSLSERAVVDGRGCHTSLRFGVKAKENQERILRCTGYLNSIKSYKARFIANSNSCI